MFNDINIWAVLLAAFSVFVIGGVWYTPVLFGNIWLKAEGKLKGNKRHSPLVFVATFWLSLAAAWVFALFLGPNPGFTYAVGAGFTIGLSWVVSSFGMNYLFAGRDYRLFLIDGGYHLLQFILYGIILGLWH